MKRIAKFAVLSAIVVTAGVLYNSMSLPAKAQPTQNRTLTEYIPADSTAVITSAGKTIAFDGSNLGQAINSDFAQRYIEIFAKFIQQEIDKSEDENQQAMGEAMIKFFKNIYARPFAMSVGDCSDPDALEVITLIDTGKEKQNIKNIIESFLAEVQKTEQFKARSTIKQETLGDTSYQVISSKRDAFKFAWGFVKDSNMLFVIVDRDVKKILRKLVNVTPAKSIARNKLYIERMKHVTSGDPQFSIYVDCDKLSKSLDKMAAKKLKNLPPGLVESNTKFHDAFKKINMNIQCYATAVDIVNKGMRTRSKVFMKDANKVPFWDAFSSTKISDADLKSIPADADFFYAAKVDLKKVFATVKNLGKIFPKKDSEAPDFETQLAQGLMMFKQMTGLDFEDDLIAAFDGSMLISSAESQGGRLTGTVLSFGLADETKMQKVIATIQQRAMDMMGQGGSVKIQTTKQGDVEINYVAMNFESFGMPIAPAWAIANNRLYIALYPQVLQSTLGNKSKSITTNKDYSTLLANRKSNPQSLMFINTPKIMRSLYPLVLVLGTMGTNTLDGYLGGSEQLPLFPSDINSFSKFFKSSIQACYFTNDGILVDSYGTLPDFKGMVDLAHLPGVALYIKSMGDIQEASAKVSVYHSSLRLVQIRLIAYKAEKTKYPRKLSDLVDSGDADDYEIEDILYAGAGLKNGGIMCYIDPKKFKNKGTYYITTTGEIKWVDIKTLNKLLPAGKKWAPKPELDPEAF